MPAQTREAASRGSFEDIAGMDIVKTLRCMDEQQFYEAPATTYHDCQRAADEIERLRSEVSDLRKRLDAFYRELELQQPISITETA